MKIENNNRIAELVTEIFGEAQKYLESSISQAQPGARMSMTVEELAKELSISRAKAYALAREDGFPVFHVGRKVLVNRRGLQEWMNKGGTANEKAC